MDFGPYLNYAIAAAIVLALLVVCMLILRAVGGRVRARQGSRLGVSEYHEVDKQRRLVLVRRDDVEHLLLIGGEQDVVVETGIGRQSAAHAPYPIEERSAAPPSPLRHSPAFERQEPVEPPVFGRGEGEDSKTVPLRPAPRPPVFGDRPAEPPRRRAEPRLEPVKKLDDER